MSLHNIPEKLLNRSQQAQGELEITAEGFVSQVIDNLRNFCDDYKNFREVANRVESKLLAGETPEQIGLSYQYAESIASKIKAYAGKDEELSSLVLGSLRLNYPNLMGRIDEGTLDEGALEELGRVYPVFGELVHATSYQRQQTE